MMRFSILLYIPQVLNTITEWVGFKLAVMKHRETEAVLNNGLLPEDKKVGLSEMLDKYLRLINEFLFDKARKVTTFDQLKIFWKEFNNASQFEEDRAKFIFPQNAFENFDRNLLKNITDSVQKSAGPDEIDESKYNLDKVTSETPHQPVFIEDLTEELENLQTAWETMRTGHVFSVNISRLPLPAEFIKEEIEFKNAHETIAKERKKLDNASNSDLEESIRNAEKNTGDFSASPVRSETQKRCSESEDQEWRRTGS